MDPAVRPPWLKSTQTGDNDCMAQEWPNDPDDDSNALAGVLHAVLVEAVVVGLVVLLWWWWVAIVP